MLWIKVALSQFKLVNQTSRTLQAERSLETTSDDIKAVGRFNGKMNGLL